MNASSHIFATLALTSLLAIASVASQATTLITDDLNSYAVGNSVTTGQTHLGSIGQGWLSPWRASSGNANSVKSTITNTDSLSSGENYFSTTIITSAGKTQQAGSGGSLSRAYDATSISSSGTTAFGVSFDFRADSFDNNMRFNLADAKNRGAFYDSTATWVLSAYDGYWHISNGTQFTSTGLPFAAGITYSISINENPMTRMWDVTISSSSGSVQLNNLSFRTTSWATATDPENGRWLTFSSSEIINASETSIGDLQASFSVDNIVISSIPEPATTALFIGFLLFGLAAFRRHSRG